MDKLFRVIDVNFNRCKEGLRVIEDLERFIFENNNFRLKVRRIRHSLDSFLKNDIIKNAIKYRDSKKDIGSTTDNLELIRKDYFEILYTNFQRVKESLRVIEEFLKIIKPTLVRKIKQIRYDIYSLEKDIYLKQIVFVLNKKNKI